jgi:hypothetical protein
MNGIDRATERRRRTSGPWQFLRLTFFLILGMLCFSGTAMALSSYLTAFKTRYPSSTTATTAWSSTTTQCNVCHSSGGGTDLNPSAKPLPRRGTYSQLLRL